MIKSGLWIILLLNIMLLIKRWKLYDFNHLFYSKITYFGNWLYTWIHNMEPGHMTIEVPIRHIDIWLPAIRYLKMGFYHIAKSLERIRKSLTIFGMDTSFLLIGMRLLSHMDWGHLLPKNVDSSHGRLGIYYACAFMDSKHSVRISCVATLDTILCPSSGMAVLLRHCSPNSNVQLGESLILPSMPLPGSHIYWNVMHMVTKLAKQFVVIEMSHYTQGRQN